MFIAMTQRGHNPAGAFAGKGVPHWGQFSEFVVMPVTYRLEIDCYMGEKEGKPQMDTDEHRLGREKSFF
ncbi:MAG: hypothetical protein ABJC04_10700 [Verrucomicrobiota bacterium]